ncbi:MAG: hypothetical protein ISN28_16040 [Ectothiorhodospiraceae bacterium AqS1]|nr:hypothetical protein [Ectothiorhodospiraceae bacterium AqS1]
MQPEQRKPDLKFEFLTEHSSFLCSEYQQKREEWRCSSFSWFRDHPPARKSSICRKLISAWLRDEGFEVTPVKGKEADCEVNGFRVKIKLSMLWEQKRYVFQQIKDQNYDLMICFGISPFEAHAWVLSKSFVLEGWDKLPDFKTQHAGKSGKDTAWIHVDAGSPHEWLNEKGGDLSTALMVLRRELEAKNL